MRICRVTQCSKKDCHTIDGCEITDEKRALACAPPHDRLLPMAITSPSVATCRRRRQRATHAHHVRSPTLFATAFHDQPGVARAWARLRSSASVHADDASGSKRAAAGIHRRAAPASLNLMHQQVPACQIKCFGNWQRLLGITFCKMTNCRMQL